MFTELATGEVGRIRGFFRREGTQVAAFATSDGFVIKGEAILTGSIATVSATSTPATHPDVISTGGCDPIGYHGSPVCAANLGAAPSERENFNEPSVAFADFDGDGTQDLVVTYGAPFATENEQRVYRGVGGGNYTLRATLDSRLRSPYVDYSNIVVADFDDDGRPDLAVSGVILAGQTDVRTAIFANRATSSSPSRTASAKGRPIPVRRASLRATMTPTAASTLPSSPTTE